MSWEDRWDDATQQYIPAWNPGKLPRDSFGNPPPVYDATPSFLSQRAAAVNAFRDPLHFDAGNAAPPRRSFGNPPPVATQAPRLPPARTEPRDSFGNPPPSHGGPSPSSRSLCGYPPSPQQMNFRLTTI